MAEEETNRCKRKTSKHNPCTRYFSWVFFTHGFHVLMNGFSASHGFVFFWSLLWIIASSPTCTHVPYIRVLCPWDWIFTSSGLVFFLSLWIWTFGPTCALVPYITILCPWEWISTSWGLVFEFMVMHAFSNVFLMMPMHEAIKWHINSINPFCVACILFVGRFCKLCVLFVWYTRRC